MGNRSKRSHWAVHKQLGNGVLMRRFVRKGRKMKVSVPSAMGTESKAEFLEKRRAKRCGAKMHQEQ